MLGYAAEITTKAAFLLRRLKKRCKIELSQYPGGCLGEYNPRITLSAKLVDALVFVAEASHIAILIVVMDGSGLAQTY